MSKSKRKTPASTICCCKSQKQDKQHYNRIFRRISRKMLRKGQVENLPRRPMEVMDAWTMAGDGKKYWGFAFGERWFQQLMRK